MKIKYEYPKFANWVSIHRIKETDRFLVKDHLLEGEYEFGDVEYVRFVKSLDGETDPYTINTSLSRDDVEHFLNFLNENELVRYGRVVKIGVGSALFSILFPKRAAPIKRIIARILSFLLLVSFIPVFTTGCYFFPKIDIDFNPLQTVIGYVLGLATAMIVHEVFGHGLANVAYNIIGKNYEIGIMVQHFVMFGAYVLLDEQQIKKRWHRIQTLAAGVEQNFLTAGLSLILSYYVPSISTILFNIGISNAIIGLINLLLVNGLDGYHIFCELLGCDHDIVGQAVTAFMNRSFLPKGSTSNMKILSSFFIIVTQAAFPILLVINVLGVISWFS